MRSDRLKLIKADSPTGNDTVDKVGNDMASAGSGVADVGGKIAEVAEVAPLMLKDELKVPEGEADMPKQIRELCEAYEKMGYDKGYRAGLEAGVKMAQQINESVLPHRASLRFNKIADAELKSMFHGIMNAIDAGHIAPDQATSLKERIRETLMHWLAEHREPLIGKINYKALIIKRANKASEEYVKELDTEAKEISDKINKKYKDMTTEKELLVANYRSLIVKKAKYKP